MQQPRKESSNGELTLEAVLAEEGARDALLAATRRALAGGAAVGDVADALLGALGGEEGGATLALEALAVVIEAGGLADPSPPLAARLLSLAAEGATVCVRQLAVRCLASMPAGSVRAASSSSSLTARAAAMLLRAVAPS